ncbi:hypothetical protein EDD76_11373 [Kineothrix alysoides]|uniref:DUF6774 domain-containing protein n=1 Tax=Kineothrix alysoides TaxID=1469948 RepID=A0A4R1QR83_9FIRM|nr:DUF6774 domain-containing protein [Kineothrix alysoides]TCL55937.1 hypothetical protein EDD76_11373 [Kineothrix alysoides]
MNSCELVTFITATACAISNCCDKDEIAMLSAIFSQLGDTLATMLTHDEICNKEE